MSLPPGFLDELKSRLSLAEVAARKVTWEARKSNPGKGDYWAPCPFHQEKTASFHVDDRKGFYYCFGCQAKGDMFGFVKDTENVGFMEAVEILAREAGMPMPARDPKAQEKADARSVLVKVMEEAVKFTRLQLKTARAADARSYLERRGLSAEIVERFEIGFCPSDRGAMMSHLRNKGISETDIVAAGLAIKPDDGGTAFDRFRGRIMFPIRDAAGRAIAFGGRAMDPNARAKYLNSPETMLFDKGRVLYNHGPAREASGKSARLIVAEGYMDVIALAAHGFDEAVAPLGTAITEDQLMLMWRFADEPIVALDGDKAGLRAARRLLDIALPKLAAGKSLRFCVLPDGQDPDDLLRANGAKAMQDLLDNAVPLIEMLWQRETEDLVLDSPERRAKLDQSLKAALSKIADPSVRGHYDAEIRHRRNELFRRDTGGGRQTAQSSGFSPGRGGPSRGGFRKAAPTAALPDTRTSALGTERAGIESDIRESTILAICVAHPGLAVTHEAQLETLEFHNRDWAGLRDQILRHCHDVSDRLKISEQINEDIGPATLEKLFALGHIRANPNLRPNADPTRVERALIDDMTRHRAIMGHMNEIREAEAELQGTDENEGVTWRLQQALAAKEAARLGSFEDEDNKSTEAEKLSQYLQKLIDDQSWIKK